MEEETEQAARKDCPRCGSNRWMTDLEVLAQGFQIAVPPEKWRLHKGISNVRASACADCSYVEISALKPMTLWHEWSKQNR